jgi:hypothetical protein
MKTCNRSRYYRNERQLLCRSNTLKLKDVRASARPEKVRGRIRLVRNRTPLLTEPPAVAGGAAACIAAALIACMPLLGRPVAATYAAAQSTPGRFCRNWSQTRSTPNAHCHHDVKILSHHCKSAPRLPALILALPLCFRGFTNQVPPCSYSRAIDLRNVTPSAPTG